MNNIKMKIKTIQCFTRLLVSAFKVINKFPKNSNWGMRYVYITIGVIVERGIEYPIDKIIRKLMRTDNLINWYPDARTKSHFHEELK